MRLCVGIPEPNVSKPVLEAAAEAVTRLDEDLIRQGKAPDFHDALEHGQVKWKPEPPGNENFDNAETVVKRGWGDCDDLAPWRAASARATGEDPGARAIAVRRSPTLWHMMVRRSDGRLEDPSVEAGMRASRPGAAPAVMPLMQTAQVVGGSKRPMIAVRPIYLVGGVYSSRPIGWQARVDLPLSEMDSALVQLHHAPVASQAIVGACIAACDLAEASGTFVDPETYAPVDAIAGLLCGADWRAVDVHCGELARERAEQWLDHAESVCGSLFGDIGDFVSHAVSTASHVVSSVSHVLQPVADIGKQVLSAAQGVISLIPGVGTGISSAISAGLALLSGGSPLEIALRAAYGAIPIPPGIRNLTDMVLDAVLALASTGDPAEAAIAVARSRVPEGLPRDVFDTLIHIIAHHHSGGAPTHAIAHPKPGTPATAPVRLVLRPRPGAPPPRPAPRAPAPARRTSPAPYRPPFMRYVPASARWVPPHGVSLQ